MTARFLGTLLLACAGAGLGYCAASRQLKRQKTLELLARLWNYWEGLLAARALTGPALLQCAAANPAFAPLALPETGRLAALPLPPLPEDLTVELRESLCILGSADRAGARAELQRMAELCRCQARRQADRAARALVLWPRLGACAGLLLAVLLW